MQGLNAFQDYRYQVWAVVSVDNHAPSAQVLHESVLSRPAISPVPPLSFVGYAMSYGIATCAPHRGDC